MHWRLEEIQTLFAGFFRLERLVLRHERFQGGEMRITRELLERGDAVGVVIHDPARDATLLVEQFRPGPAKRGENPWLIEIVAGMLRPGEDPAACAQREALEEAHCAVRDLKQLAVVYASPGGTSERFFLFYARAAEKTPTKLPAPDADEDVRAFWVPVEEALAMCRDGRIRSALPIMALSFAFADRWRGFNPTP